MKNVIKKVFEFVTLTALLAIIAWAIASNAKETKETKPHGTSTFLYEAGGCNVYQLKDGTGENPLLVSKCDILK